METSHTYLLVKTWWMRSSRKSSVPCFGVSTRVSGRSGKPTDGGVSGMVSHTNPTTSNESPAGTKKHKRQLYSTSTPHSSRTTIAPMQCDVFHSDILVGKSRGRYQCVSNRAHG